MATDPTCQFECVPPEVLLQIAKLLPDLASLHALAMPHCIPTAAPIRRRGSERHNDQHVLHNAADTRSDSVDNPYADHGTARLDVGRVYTTCSAADYLDELPSARYLRASHTDNITVQCLGYGSTCARLGADLLDSSSPRASRCAAASKTTC